MMWIFMKFGNWVGYVPEKSLLNFRSGPEIYLVYFIAFIVNPVVG